MHVKRKIRIFITMTPAFLLALAVTRTGVLALQGVHLQNFEIQNVLAGFQFGLQGGDDVDTGNNHLGPVGQAFFHQKV